MSNNTKVNYVKCGQFDNSRLYFDHSAPARGTATPLCGRHGISSFGDFCTDITDDKLAKKENGKLDLSYCERCSEPTDPWSKYSVLKKNNFHSEAQSILDKKNKEKKRVRYNFSTFSYFYISYFSY